MKNILIPLTLVVILTTNCSQAEGNVPLSKEQLFKIYSEKVAELKLPTVDLNKVKISKFGSVEDINVDAYGRKIIRAGCWEIDFAMDIDPYTGRIHACYNYSIGDITEDVKNIPLFKDIPEPSKKKEDIIKEAENYLKILNNGKMPDNLQFKEAEYHNGGWRNHMHPFMGEWQVTWVQREGPYTLGNICMSINEKFGFSGFSDNRYLTYYPPKKIKITKEKAIAMAGKDINKIILKGYKVEGPASAELTITEQNMYAQKLNPNYIKHPQSYARLAWAVVSKCVCDAKLKDGIKLEPDYYTIYYDAETGEVLGASW